MRAGAALFVVVVGSIAAAFACGGSQTTGGPSTTPTITATSSSVGTKTADDAKAICARVCAVQTKCGGDTSACSMRCLPIARVLLPEVVVKMVECAETNAPGSCEGDDLEKRKHLIGKCVVDATQLHMAEAKDTISLLAKAICDRDASCGVPSESGPAECLGHARGEIMSTEGESSGGLYGSMRPSKVDELVACLGGPCDQRQLQADAEVERCLDAVLAKAAESQ
jgi:hypothetical protein